MSNKSEVQQPWYWQGTRYKEGFCGVKLLILGEGAYVKTADLPSPALLVELHIDPAKVLPKDRHWMRTYSRFIRIMSATQSRQEVWNQLAFHNYLTTPAGVAPRQSPLPDDEAWAGAKPFFEEVVLNLRPRPQGVIVWGKRLWTRLEALQLIADNHSDSGVLKIADFTMPAFRLRHPSSCPRVEEWAKKVKQFVDDVRSAQAQQVAT